MDGDVMTVGVVGAGRWGRRLAAAFGKHFDIRGFCHLGRTETRTWIEGEFPGITVTDRLSDLLEDEHVDAIAIATPIATHAHIAALALSAGKHTFVEKPLATTTEECRSLVDAAKRRGLALFTGHVFLYDPVFNELRRITQADPVAKMNTSWHKFGTFDEDIVWNLMAHEVALGIGLFGRRPSNGRLLHSRGFVSKSDSVIAAFGFGGTGDDLVVEIDRCDPVRSKSVTAKTESGRTFSWSENVLYECTTDGPKPIFTRPDVQPLDLEVASFRRQIHPGVSPVTDGRFGLDVVSAIEALSR
jgi:predicted dehydrogenase